MRIAMCQVFLADGDRSGNFVRIENGIAEAKESGAEIACLPETAILGWVNPDAHERACAIPGEDSNRLCGLAEKYEIYVCVGLAEKDGEDLYDSAVLIDDTGEILLKHRKINLLAELMEPAYTAGDGVGVAETKFGRAGLLICADTHTDEILERMGALKPDLLLVPYGYAAVEEDWPGHGKELERVVANAASRAGAVVVGTNAMGAISNGPWRGRVYGGQSAMADNNGAIMAKARDRDRDIVVVEVEIGGGDMG
ncbi:MAG: carbon-nitrogen hydrolase family protein [Phycisphaerae bacterium]|nr:carbon-nitrogen hydrolase family protein [Phycisphaerae bacterium]